jgi:hypothetical protein
MTPEHQCAVEELLLTFASCPHDVAYDLLFRDLLCFYLVIRQGQIVSVKWPPMHFYYGWE